MSSIDLKFWPDFNFGRKQQLVHEFVHRFSLHEALDKPIRGGCETSPWIQQPLFLPIAAAGSLWGYFSSTSPLTENNDLASSSQTQFQVGNTNCNI